MKLGTLRHALILGAFCLGFGVILASTENFAAGDIADRRMEDRLASLAQVLPADRYDNNPLQSTLTLADAEGKPVVVYRALQQGQLVGVAYEIRGSGYAGEIRLMMGVDVQGRIFGVRVLSHKETPGLGDKMEIKKSAWIDRFSGLSLAAPLPERWKVRKDGGDFDQFTGATITPRAVVGAVKRGLEFFAANQASLLAAPSLEEKS